MITIVAVLRLMTDHGPMSNGLLSGGLMSDGLINLQYQVG